MALYRLFVTWPASVPEHIGICSPAVAWTECADFMSAGAIKVEVVPV